MPKIARLRRATYFADRKAQVAVRREPVQHDVGEHGHEFLEIVIVLSGSGVHVTHGVRQKLASGDVLVINSSRSHAYETTHSLNLVNILVHEGIFEQTEKQLGTLPGYHALFTLEPVRWRQRKFTSHLRLKPEDLKLAVSWIEALEAESRLKSEGSLLLVRSWMILLIGLLARQYGKKTPHAMPLPMEVRLGRILSRIEQGDCDKFTMGELARQASMSQRTFLRRFRESTGYSPIDYVLRARIRRAKELLRTNIAGLSTTEIAFQCGFQDSNYFSRQFRRVTGKSPREYAKTTA